MLAFKTVVDIPGISGQQINDFMLNCTDEDYQKWWPGTHLAFHTIKRYPNDLGNQVYFDEYIGTRRLKFRGVITELAPGKHIAWQMVKGIRLLSWLILEFEDYAMGVRVIHELKVGFKGIGKLLDPVLKLYFSDTFIQALNQHAETEFPKLAQILTSGT